ncbi:MAG: disulfide oxidoreductase [Euryarchaeota archaeon]|nr:disulfide oxidoreductase [Euryarchaeota archaeon]
MKKSQSVSAVLGPTNTGKTHYAVERMLSYESGIIGLPLRLLAREVYDKIVRLKGVSSVALLTGEERIVPNKAQYWICTVEAMPEGMSSEFLAVDEIQLANDPERGHVFTARLLKSRGALETLFLGSETMRYPIKSLVPDAHFISRERLSNLVYTGSKKISRIPTRSAIVGFSVDNVYSIAEILRRLKGGAAVVMGALSPRTRNAQVELYQNGDVDYLVATDAIGMGLNLDVNHVAFSSLTKFDGRRNRDLAPNELAQIAGRAGRGMNNGTFGVTGEAKPLDPKVASSIMEHRFAPQTTLQWRNANLEFGTIDRLIASLEVLPNNPSLIKARDSEDLLVLKTLSQSDSIIERVKEPAAVKLLWKVCSIPDFRSIGHGQHASLLETIFTYLFDLRRIPEDWLQKQVSSLEITHGNIDTLSKRLAYMRTWTYVSQRKGWVDDESHWRNRTRSIEDLLSDALHHCLTKRFVDRRTSVLLRALKDGEAMLAEVDNEGKVTVEGEFVGKLEGFRFITDKDANGAEAKALRTAAMEALKPHFNLMSDRFYNAPDTEIDFTDQGGLMWGENAVGKFLAGENPLKPRIHVFIEDNVNTEIQQKVERRLQHFVDRKIATLFEPLLALERDDKLAGLARGFAFTLVENFGLVPRATVTEIVKSLDQDARATLRRHGVRFGQYTIFMPLLLKPAPTRLRLVLWSLVKKIDEFPSAPPPGLVTVPSASMVLSGLDTMSGYRNAGDRAIRIDMLERLADMLRLQDSRSGFESNSDMLSITGMTLEQFAGLMVGLGYKAEKGSRLKAVSEDRTDTKTEINQTPLAKTVDESNGNLEEVTTNESTDDTALDMHEEFYKFSWVPKKLNTGKNFSKKDGKSKKQKSKLSVAVSAKSSRSSSKNNKSQEKQIDPDNPFAKALMGFKQEN